MVFVRTSDTAPLWLRHRSWRHIGIPGDLRCWLLNTASLTDRLRTACNGRFRVRVLGEKWQKPRRDEMKVLGMGRSHVGLVRQVQLLCDESPCVYARTVIPVTTLTGKQRRLGFLGDKPLGAFLFADPGMQREEVELASIRAGQSMFAQATTGLKTVPEEIWGRRSVFRVGGKPLLVTEVFLPDLPEYGA